MKVTLLGASGGEVTGSAYMFQTEQSSVLVDAESFKAARGRELHGPFERKTRKLTPWCSPMPISITRAGCRCSTRFEYKGPDHATPATIELTEIILRDSAYSEQDAKT